VENPAVVGVTTVLGKTFELDEAGEVLIPSLRDDSLACAAFFCASGSYASFTSNFQTPLKEIAAQRLCSTRRIIQPLEAALFP
jgi:hypothetical protein